MKTPIEYYKTLNTWMEQDTFSQAVLYCMIIIDQACLDSLNDSDDYDRYYHGLHEASLRLNSLFHDIVQEDMKHVNSEG